MRDTFVYKDCKIIVIIDILYVHKVTQQCCDNTTLGVFTATNRLWQKHAVSIQSVTNCKAFQGIKKGLLDIFPPGT